MKLSDLAIGKAGEYLVCADLILNGHVAFPSEQGLPYDIVADINGSLLKVQVKTTSGVKQAPTRKNHMPAYVFNVKRCGKNGKQTYRVGDVDIFALVGLDSKSIAYLTTKQAKSTMLFRNPLLRGSYRDEVRAVRSSDIRADREIGLRNFQIAEKYKMDKAVISRMLLKPSKYNSGCPYLDAFTLDDCLKSVAANDNQKKARAA